MPRIYVLPDKREIRAGWPFELNDLKYPGNWVVLATLDEIADAGIVIRDDPDPVPPPPEPEPDPSTTIEGRLAILEKDNAALQSVLVKKAIVTQVEIDAEKPADVIEVKP